MSDSDAVWGTGTDTLVFAHAGLADSANYNCLVRLNDCGIAVTQMATLTVYPSGSVDGNGDGTADGRDIAAFVSGLVNHEPVSTGLCAYDLSGDGIVNLDDLGPFVARLLDSGG